MEAFSNGKKRGRSRHIGGRVVGHGRGFDGEPVGLLCACGRYGAKSRQRGLNGRCGTIIRRNNG